MKRIILVLVAIFTITQAFAQVEVDPSTYQFHDQQVNYSSQPKSFQITNSGGDPVVIEPDDIYLTGQDAQKTNFSVLTYNIWHDSQNWPERLERMLPEIKDLEPDVIGLQEVIQRSDLENQAKTLADSLGYHYYFSSQADPDASTRFGNAILSKHPVEDTGWTTLEHPDETRIATRMNIVVNGHSIDFYTAHLHNVAVNKEIREAQINDLLDFIEQTSTGDYVFVTGDYNANPDWEEMELMYQDYQDVYPLFHENHTYPEHSTLNPNLGHIQRRIDYIFYRKDTELFLEPLQAKVVLDTANQDGVYGSDHYGVFASFTLLSDTEDFVLENLSEPIELQSGDSTEVSVAFAPLSTGQKSVYLHARDDSAAISGEGYDATVQDYPWQEHFPADSFPLGWESASDNWSLQNTSDAGGEAPEVVFGSDQNTDGTYTLYAPPFNTQKLDSMTLSFKHHLSNPQNQGGFTLKLISLVDEKQQLIAQWDSPQNISAETFSTTLNSSLHGIGAESLRLAWVVDGDPSAFSHWHIDDIQTEAFPALHISPADHDFENVEIQKQSEEKIFNLSNAGGGTLTIDPGEISISGDDAGHFVLNNLENSVALENEEDTTVGVSFVPQSVGEKHANLIIKEDTVNLRGNAFDATISTLPWTENFAGMAGEDVPLGWERDSENWGIFNASNAGGEEPEMVFWWQPEIEGSFYLKTPDFKLENADTLVLSFKHRVRNFGSPGNYTLKVVTLANDEESLVTEWVDPATIEAQEVTYILDAENHHTNADSFRLAWVFDGPTDNITQWDIDDIRLITAMDTIIPEISPESHHFEDTPVDEESESQPFQIKNNGGVPWTLHPDDVAIEGDDAEMFHLENLTEETTLAQYESAQVSVSFQPTTDGAKKAKLVIGSKEVALSGDAIKTNTSVSENTGKQDGTFEIYPNPSSENVIIETERNATITLWNVAGKMILKEKSPGRKELNISGLKSGVYLIQCETEHQSSIKKLMVR